jgi:hypothetical protein
MIQEEISLVRRVWRAKRRRKSPTSSTHILSNKHKVTKITLSLE